MINLRAPSNVATLTANVFSQYRNLVAMRRPPLQSQAASLSMGMRDEDELTRSSRAAAGASGLDVINPTIGLQQRWLRLLRAGQVLHRLEISPYA
jgi:hypothetical protein